MKRYIDFTEVNASIHSFDFVRHQFYGLQKIIDHLPELLLQKKLLSHITSCYSPCSTTSYVLENYAESIQNIDDKGVLEVLYGHYTFLISATFKELQDQPNIDLSQPIRIPKNLADPIIVLSNKLNLPPVLTYYSHLILNWDHQEDRPIRRFSIRPKQEKNQKIMHDFESGFMAVHIQIEKKSLPITTTLNTIIDAFNAKTENQLDIVVENLKSLVNELNSIMSLLKTMYSQCSPSEYAKYIRIFLGAYKKIQLNDEKMISFPGPSAAQSPTLLLFNYIFQANQSPNQNLTLVLNQAVQLIPNDKMCVVKEIAAQFHANFLSIKSNQQLFRAYIELYYGYYHFLVEHFKLVFDYIIKPAQALQNKSILNREGTGTSDPQDLSLRVQLIHQDIIRLCNEYHQRHGDQYFLYDEYAHEKSL